MEKYRAIPKGYMTVGEVAKKMDVTVRTLQHYDKEGLLSPSAMSDGGRRLYTDKDIVKLHQILSLNRTDKRFGIKTHLKNPPLKKAAVITGGAGDDRRVAFRNKRLPVIQHWCHENRESWNRQRNDSFQNR